MFSDVFLAVMCEKFRFHLRANIVISKVHRDATPLIYRQLTHKSRWIVTKIVSRIMYKFNFTPSVNASQAQVFDKGDEAFCLYLIYPHDFRFSRLLARRNTDRFSSCQIRRSCSAPMGYLAAGRSDGKPFEGPYCLERLSIICIILSTAAVIVLRYCSCSGLTGLVVTLGTM